MEVYLSQSKLAWLCMIHGITMKGESRGCKTSLGLSLASQSLGQRGGTQQFASECQHLTLCPTCWFQRPQFGRNHQPLLNWPWQGDKDFLIYAYSNWWFIVLNCTGSHLFYSHLFNPFLSSQKESNKTRFIFRVMFLNYLFFFWSGLYFEYLMTCNWCFIVRSGRRSWLHSAALVQFPVTCCKGKTKNLISD